MTAIAETRHRRLKAPIAPSTFEPVSHDERATGRSRRAAS